MRLNFETELVGKGIRLVPYRREFVDKYNGWMQDEYLQEMTASEPLTLAEEYEMQESWKEDDKKMTFIMLARERDEEESPGAAVDYSWYQERMCGDVNLFFNDRDDARVCEIEVMIAEEKFRRQGRAKEALLIIMAYALEQLDVRRFYCKINETNHGSIRLFTEALGYKEVNYVKAFREYEYDLIVDYVGREGYVDEDEPEESEEVVAQKKSDAAVIKAALIVSGVYVEQAFPL